MDSEDPGWVQRLEKDGVEEDSPARSVLAGRLKAHPSFGECYRSLGASPEIVAWVEEGYKLPFIQDPGVPQECANNVSAREHMQFVRQELAKLLQMGCVEKRAKPHFVNPLSVVYSNKWRLVLDCSRLLNPLLSKATVRLEDLSYLPDIFQAGDFGATDDLEAGYWQVNFR